MSHRTDELFEAAKALPNEERAVLALQLLDSVGESEPEIERAWRDEVQRRINDVDACPSSPNASLPRGDAPLFAGTARTLDLER